MRCIKYKILIILSFFWGAFITTEAQEKYSHISNISVDTKLQNHNITSIVQDANGFLWLGTNLGLYRYDGYHFIAYTIITKPSLLDNTITSLLIDGDNLWIGTKEGINILNTNTYSVLSLTHQKNDDTSIANNSITKIFKDKNNTIWIGYALNIISKHIGDTNFQNLIVTGFPTNYSLNEIFEVSNATYIIKLNDEKTKASKIISAQLKNGKLHTKVIREIDYNSEILFKRDTSVYLAHKNKISIYDIDTENFKLTNIPFENTENIHSLAFTDNENTVYFGTNKSSFYRLTGYENISHFNTKIDTQERMLNTFFVDNSGLLWVGTSNGLYTLKKQKFLFKKYTISNELNKTTKIQSLLQDTKGAIYTINQKSLFKYDSITDQFHNLNCIPTLNATLNDIKENDSTSFLVGLESKGIGIYNKNTTILKPYFEANKTSSINSVLKLYKDSHNILWIGTTNGLVYYNKKNDSLVKKLNSNSAKNTINNDVIFDIKIDKNNQLWVGTNTGLYHLKVDYSTLPLSIEIIKIKNIAYKIHSILIDKSILWLTTQFNGLVKYNSSNQKIRTFNKSLGLSNNTTYSLLPGTKNELWIGTLNGLSRFDTISEQFLNFYDYDGLVGNNFSASSQLKTKKGELFFGGQNGITSFLPSEIEVPATNFNLNLINVSWYNHSKNITFNSNKINNHTLSNITIPYTNAFVKFEFALTNYFIPQNNNFKYRLNGLHSDWRILKETNELSFTNLPPGDYILEVMGTTSIGVHNKKMLIQPITVLQIYYKKWWFLTASVVLFGMFLFFIRKYELGHINKMEQLRLKISRDLHDELGSFLTGIAIKSDLLLEKVDFQSKKELFKEISTHCRSAVDTLSDIVWAIDSKNNSLQNLSDRMESFLFQFLTPQNIKIIFKPLKTTKPLEINQDYRQHVFLIFKEAITNIMKHSNATLVFVSITNEKNNLKLTIKDNGTEFTKNGSSLDGNGIKNMKLRAKKIKGDIKFYNDKGYVIELLFKYLK